MSIAYQCDAKGFFVGAVEDNGFLPNGATYVAPGKEKKGYTQRFNGSKWEYVEDHKGEHGYVDGKPFEIKQFGPYPEGWSATPPPLTDEELAEQVRAERDGKLAASDKYMTGDFPGAEGKEDAIKAYRKALRDVPSQSGFPKNVKWPTDPLA